jgi:hypothetical protein
MIDVDDFDAAEKYNDLSRNARRLYRQTIISIPMM